MDRGGRAIDNVFVERLWRTIKYGHIYLNPAAGGTELKEGLGKYIEFYNAERPHDGLMARLPTRSTSRPRSTEP